MQVRGSTPFRSEMVRGRPAWHALAASPLREGEVVNTCAIIRAIQYNGGACGDLPDFSDPASDIAAREHPYCCLDDGY